MADDDMLKENQQFVFGRMALVGFVGEIVNLK